MYHPEPYWNEVARRIAARDDIKIIAGDDEPFYRYQRRRFLQLLHRIDVKGKLVLELGPGPGGNLAELLKGQPRELYGVDVSDEMIAIARNLLKDMPVTITKSNGQEIPFADRYFDLSLTSTVLQHNTDEAMLRQVVSELCRVTRSEICIFEKIKAQVSGTELCMGRPVTYYRDLFAAGGFGLEYVEFFNIQASYYVSGAIRKLFNRRARREGEPPSKVSVLLQKISLPFTSIIDRVLPLKKELAMLRFVRKAGRE